MRRKTFGRALSRENPGEGPGGRGEKPGARRFPWAASARPAGWLFQALPLARLGLTLLRAQQKRGSPVHPGLPMSNYHL